MNYGTTIAACFGSQNVAKVKSLQRSVLVCIKNARSAASSMVVTAQEDSKRVVSYLMNSFSTNLLHFFAEYKNYTGDKVDITRNNSHGDSAGQMCGRYSNEYQ